MSRGSMPQDQQPGAPGGVRPGRVIAGRYRLLRELGRGGMGKVWLAGDTLLHRQVAVKELRPSPGLSDEGRQAQQQRALAEARSVARVTHPNAVALYEIIEGTAADEAVYLIMEYAEGPTLRDLIDSRGALPAAEVAAYGLQLLDVLAAAHALDIVHRDVKPGNVIIAPGGQVKLADFGIAYTVGSDRQTTTGVMGTQAYMAPELFEPGSMITPAVDLWSLGATLYAAAEGREPFEQGATAPTLRAVLFDELPVPRCAPGLAAVISGLLNRDPQQRATIDQARAALSGPLGQRPAGLVPGQAGTGQAKAPTREPRPGWNPDAVTGLRSYPTPPADVGPVKRRRSLRVGRRAAIAVASLAAAACLTAAGVLVAARLPHHASATGRARSVAATRSLTTAPGSHASPSASVSAGATGGGAASGPGGSTGSAGPGGSGGSSGSSGSGGVSGPGGSGGSGGSGGGSSSGSGGGSGGGGSSSGGASPPRNPVEDVFWRGSGGNLWEASGAPGGNLSGAHVVTSGGEPANGPNGMGSGPTAGADSAGHIYVFWKGLGDDLWEAYWNGSSWAGPLSRGMDTLASAPTVAVEPNGTYYVFWEGANQDLYEAQGAGSGAPGAQHAIETSIGSSPGAAYGGGRVYVSWEGEANEHLWDTYLNGSSWAGPYEETAENSVDGGGPSAAVTPGGTAYVFWRGPNNGDIYVAHGSATGALGGPDDLGAGSLGSPPGAAADASGRLYAYYDGAGKAQLWDMYWTGSAWIASQARLATPLDGTAPAVVITG